MVFNLLHHSNITEHQTTLKARITPLQFNQERNSKTIHSNQAAPVSDLLAERLQSCRLPTS